MKQPTAEEIKKLRAKHKLTQGQAGALIYVGEQQWYKYEAGLRNMPLANWELLNIKLK